MRGASFHSSFVLRVGVGRNPVRPSVRKLSKRAQHALAQKKYSESPDFKKDRNEYQKQYRLNVKLGKAPLRPPSKESLIYDVTDPTSNDREIPVNGTKARWICRFCNRKRVEDG